MRAVVAIFVVAALACTASAAFFNVDNEAEMQKHFQFFLNKYRNGLAYGDVETGHRYQIFKANLARVNEIQSKSKLAEYGITKFSDLSPEEFRATYLPRKYTAAEISGAAHSTYTPKTSVKDLPDAFDWRTKGLVTPVKDQGQCGSCWAFSAVQNVEGQWAKAGKGLVPLAPQQVVDCDSEMAGCNGGWPFAAYEYLISTGGLEGESSYPYEGVDDKCRFDASKVVAKISSYVNITQDVAAIQSALYEIGPLSVALDANVLQSYIGGIVEPFTCGAQLDHAVLMVGWETSKDFGLIPQPVWIVKNSWGAGWGEAGYFRIVRTGGVGTCGINKAVTSSKV
eukprot:ANDGO_01626.mRNA.1 Cysteine proteinase 1